MKLREEDLKRHRTQKAKRKRRWASVFLLLLIITVGGIYAYNSRDSLPSELKTSAKEVLGLLEQWNPLTSKSVDKNSIQETINLDGSSRDFISRDELQTLLNTNFARLNTKVDTFIAQVEKLQQDVEYVGALGRSVREKVTGAEEQLGDTRKKLTLLEQSIKNQEDSFTTNLNTQKEGLETLSLKLAQREEILEELSLRIEQMDTHLQANIERLATNINTFNEDLDTLKEAANSLQDTDDSQQLSISELDQIIRNLNARLIELER